MKHKTLIIASCLFGILQTSIAGNYNEDSNFEPYAPDGVVFRVSNQDWNPDQRGNHRAVVNVPNELNQKAVRVELNWRRPDLKPEEKTVIVVGAFSGQLSPNVYIEQCKSEKGCIWFEPIKGEQSYFIYYMPYKLRLGSFSARYEPTWNDYVPYNAEAGEKWHKSLGNIEPTKGMVALFESRNRFEFFTQMGNIATQSEMQKIASMHPENPIIYTEDRAFPIRLTRQIPAKWAKEKPREDFEGWACRNEYYTWQVGVWAAHESLNNVKLQFSDLQQKGGNAIIKADELTCFNQEGTNWDGTPLHFNVNVDKGRVQALWCGVQIPEDAAVGTYEGTVTLHANGKAERTLNVKIHVEDTVLKDKGDGDLWRMARLRWLNSRIGVDSLPVTPFTKMKVHGKTIVASEKTVRLDNNGMLQSVSLNKKEVLEKPVWIEVETENGTVTFNKGKLQLKKMADGLVEWTSQQKQSGIRLICKAKMEYDGHLDYKVSLSSNQTIKAKDIRLKTSYTPYASEYMMGIGYDGGYRPKNHEWKWEGDYDSYWMGGTKAGLHTEFIGANYHGPLLMDYRTNTPPTWGNEGKGSVKVEGENAACVTASTGEKQISATPIDLEFAFDITPVKPVDTQKHFNMRFYHSAHGGFDDAIDEGANVCNLHHATELNPFINYPFIMQERLKKFVSHAHERNGQVKLYYTVRELTNHVAEIYALKSLNGEIIAEGNDHAAPWLCEHLIENYRGAWYVAWNGSKIDASFVTSPHSRWINYYLEGYRWMLENYKIDGLYMDDVSFDRNVMKRMRKIMSKYRPTAIIDLHSNNWYSNGPSNQYTDFFPYIDRLWFGEEFKYNKMTPDNWLVTFSGIPFGPMSEMLEDGGNRFLGMVYAATGRHSNAPNPAPMWKLWKEFDIEHATMIGYWDENCPVAVSDPDVKATAYVHKNKLLVSLGNFASEERTVTLKFNWKALKLNPTKVTVKAPEIENFQKARTFRADEPITIKPKEGWMLWIE